MNNPKHKPGSRTNNDLQALLLVAILTLSSLTLTVCSSRQTAPTVIGQRRVISVDQEAGTVTVSLSLWMELTRTLRRCSER